MKSYLNWEKVQVKNVNFLFHTSCEDMEINNVTVSGLEMVVCQFWNISWTKSFHYFIEN
jgi:hypothetical protein